MMLVLTLQFSTGEWERSRVLEAITPAPWRQSGWAGREFPRDEREGGSLKTEQ
jgi:hypothetical protein